MLLYINEKSPPKDEISLGGEILFKLYCVHNAAVGAGDEQIIERNLLDAVCGDG